MARDDPHFRLRFPNDLRAKVEAAARVNKRSMTAEIIHRLELSFAADEWGDGPPPSHDVPLEAYAHDLFDPFVDLSQKMDSHYRALLNEVHALNERFEATINARLPALRATGEAVVGQKPKTED
ncbi:Arc family DNA-binding protein [Xanthobacter sediminis]